MMVRNNWHSRFKCQFNLRKLESWKSSWKEKVGTRAIWPWGTFSRFWGNEYIKKFQFMVKIILKNEIFSYFHQYLDKLENRNFPSFRFFTKRTQKNFTWATPVNGCKMAIPWVTQVHLLELSRKSQEFVWFYWSDTSTCTWVTQGKCNLHPFTGVAQVHFFWCVKNKGRKWIFSKFTKK
jgi:hypothetical protein